MDVRCQKCGIEYEFDDAKVTLAGVTVKCTNCGHVFKVKKEAPPPSQAGDPMGQFGAGASMSDLPRTATATTLPPVNPQGDGAEWMVRQPSGTVFRFKELTTLQKWIVERKVGRDDEISKTGRSWKKLGDISELASFFQVVDAANAALQASVVPAQGTPGPMPAANIQPALRAGAGQNLAVVHQHVTGGTQVGMMAANLEALRGLPDAQPDAHPAGPQAPSVPVAQPAVRSAPKPAPKADVDALDEDDPVAQWGRARRRRNAAIVVVLALIVAGGVIFALQPPWLLAILGQDAAASVDAEGTRRALREDDPAALKSAAAGLRAALPGPLSGALEARILCAEAAHAREEERLHGLLRALVPAEAAKHDAAADKASERAAAALGRAYQLVSDARAKAPKLADVHIAAAAYNLEKGGLAELKADLEGARAVATPEERGSVDAELAVLQALADVRATIEKVDPTALAAASDKVPASADARLKYGKAALAVTALARSKEKAPVPATELARGKTIVDGIGVADARKELLLAVLVALEPPPVVDAGVAAVVDAGTVDAGVVAENAPETYETLMQRAERASVTEKTTLARELYNKALKLRPGSMRAWIGLGWAALDLDKNAEAQKAFRKAIAIDDGNGEAHFGLAEALKFGGNKSGALEEYQMYLKLEPNGKDAGVAKRAIESLQ